MIPLIYTLAEIFGGEPMAAMGMIYSIFIPEEIMSMVMQVTIYLTLIQGQII